MAQRKTRSGRNILNACRIQNGIKMFDIYQKRKFPRCWCYLLQMEMEETAEAEGVCQKGTRDRLPESAVGGRCRKGRLPFALGSDCIRRISKSEER